MEQDVESTLTGYRHVCSGCLSSERNLISLDGNVQIYEIFRLLMYDYAVDRFSDPLTEVNHLFCWECVAIMKRFGRFKRQVHSAQEHFRMLGMSHVQETLDHTYMSQTLSPLEATLKSDYDRIYFDYTQSLWSDTYMHLVGDDVKNEVSLMREELGDSVDGQVVHVPVLESLDEHTQVMSHIVVTSCDGSFVLPHAVKGESPTAELTVSPLTENKVETVIIQSRNKTQEKTGKKCGYVTLTMSETEMNAYRESLKEKLQYASSAYKCELCIIGFYSQQQVEDHFIAAHRIKPGLVPCKVCYAYIEEAKLQAHVEQHYTKYRCKMCDHEEHSIRLASVHVRSHLTKERDKGAVNISDASGRKRKKTSNAISGDVKPGDLRKLLSRTTIEGYKCLECEMFFKNSRARKNHVARFHREGLQCDHCQKRFVNRTTLATHLKLHEGPPPRGECPICHKMVRLIQLKYHIQRHQNKTSLECKECNKVFSHLATYQAHLKYSRAHASDEVFKFPCPMCNKGYPTKDQMQDHFNYQHLGKTTHKCPICEKPIASKANVEKHVMRVHREKKEKPRSHICQQCGKGFTDKKALTQHAVIHSGQRPLVCDICQQTFKQKASLYTHRKRLHSMFPAKKTVEFMGNTTE